MKSTNNWFESIVLSMHEWGATDARVIAAKKTIFYKTGYSKVCDLNLFESDRHFYEEVLKFCYERMLRLDHMQPYTSGAFDGGRFTVYKDSQHTSHLELFIRLSQDLEGSVYIDPNGFLEGFKSKMRNYNWLICGKSGSGKTTFLKKILDEEYKDERIAILDRYRELKLVSEHTIYLEERTTQPGGKGYVSLRSLFELSLRLNATKLVIGELRLEEFEVFSQACLTGHGSTFTTFHCDSLSSLRARLSLIDKTSFDYIKASLGAVFLRKTNDGVLIEDVCFALK